MRFFLCFRHPVRPREEWSATLQDHLDWMQGQHAAGHVLISGPARDKTHSIYLIRAASLEEAQAVAAADPFTASGDCRFDLVDWEVHQIAGVGSFVAGAHGIH